MPLRTPYLSVSLEGQDITPWVNNVTLVEDDRQADNVSLAISDPRMIYADSLFEGSIAEIDLGYAEPNQHALMLRAVITKVELSYPENGVPSLTLKGEDKSIFMGLLEKKKVWRDRHLSDIIREIAKPYGFHKVVADLQPDPAIKKPINQDGKTDLAFLQDLAQTYHAKCFVELDEGNQEVLYFLKERRIVTLRRPDKLVLSYRLGPSSNLMSFSPSFDSTYIDRLKEVNDIDKKGKKVESQDKKPTEDFLWKLDETRKGAASPADWAKIQALYDKGVKRKQDLQKKLTARKPAVGHVTSDKADLEATNDALVARQLGMTATGSTFGNIWLRAKSNVTVVGVNERFSGEWYVSSVTHKIDGSSYKTDFKCAR